MDIDVQVREARVATDKVSLRRYRGRPRLLQENEKSLFKTFHNC